MTPENKFCRGAGVFLSPPVPTAPALGLSANFKIYTSLLVTINLVFEKLLVDVYRIQKILPWEGKS